MLKRKVTSLQERETACEFLESVDYYKVSPKLSVEYIEEHPEDISQVMDQALSLSQSLRNNIMLKNRPGNTLS